MLRIGASYIRDLTVSHLLSINVQEELGGAHLPAPQNLEVHWGAKRCVLHIGGTGRCTPPHTRAHLCSSRVVFALWPHPWPWPCSFKVKVWNSLIWGKGGLINMERKGCEWIIHDHDHNLWVTMVGWVDVPNSEWGDFRRQHAVDISSC